MRAFARAVAICFKYLFLRPRISSKLKSSGGCIILEVIPVTVAPAAAVGAAGLLCSWVVAAADVVALLVVGGALIVALLQFKQNAQNIFK